MNARRRASWARAGLGLALLGAAVNDAVAAPGGTTPAAKHRGGTGGDAMSRPAARQPPGPGLASPVEDQSRGPAALRGFLIYLLDGNEPIVVSRYTEEHGQIVFEKYGGEVRIPTYEVLRIVPDVPDPAERTLPLPPPPVSPETGSAPLRPEPNLFVTMRGGGSLQVAALTPERDRVRVSVSNGSFTVPRSEIVSVVRVPPDSDPPEAWLSVLVTETDGAAEEAESSGLVPPASGLRLPYPSSERPHFLRLANGQLMRVEAFWVEDGEFRFRRFGGIVGIALNEVMRLFPEEIAPVRGRTPVRFVRRLGPDLLEVSVRSGSHRVRLLGIEPIPGTWTGEDPWRHLERGAIIHLEFDRQRYDATGSWLAYVFLPSGRMLNAELVRLGLAQPVHDGRNVRYVDLLEELAATDTDGR